MESLEGRRLLTTLLVLNGLDDGPGSLRAAIVAANDEVTNPGHDTIEFAPHVTQVTLTTEQITLTSDVTITGPAGGVTIARGQDAPGGIFVVDAVATAMLENLTITGGSASSGGGIFNSGTLTVAASTLSGNSASSGGGVFNAGTLTVTASTLSGNRAGSNGGGIFNANIGTLTVTGSTLSGNRAGGDGGGIRNSGTLTVTASTLSGNSATRTGGGMFNNGTLTVTASTISLNSGRIYGGGISNFGRLMVTSSTLSGNSASGALSSFGGGISNFGRLMVTSSTLSGNSANVDGGGIFNANIGTLTVTGSTLSGNSVIQGAGGIHNNASTVTLNNTIVANNGVDIVSRDGNLLSGSHNLIGSGVRMDGLEHGVNGNLIGTFDSPIDPRLGPLADNGGPTMTHALLLGSPAINAGSNDLAVDPQGQPLAFDQRGTGFSRIVGGIVDIGAFESPYHPPVAADVDVTTPQGTTVTGNVLDAAYDPDGDVLSVTQFVVDGTTYTAGQTATIDGVGSLVINANGAYTFTPVANYNGLVPAAVFTVSDGFLTATATLTIRVLTLSEQVAELQEDVLLLLEQGTLNEGQATALLTQLDQADALLAGGQTQAANNLIRALLIQLGNI